MFLHIFGLVVLKLNDVCFRNVVFKDDCRPSSLSSINLASFSYVFMLHWLVYKLYNALNFSCAIKDY
jgi:hypothetical protein